MRTESFLFADLHRLFLDNVGRCPHRYCISSERSDYTYRQANTRSNYLAKLVHERLATEKKKTVAVLLNDLEALSLMTSVLLKTDALFVFIESTISWDNVQKLIRDNDVSLLVTERSLHFDSVGAQIKTIFVDELEPVADANTIAYSDRGSSHLLIYSGNHHGYNEHIIKTDSLTGVMSLLDKTIPSSQSDKICFAGQIPLHEFITEILHALVTGKHIILTSSSLKDFLEDDDQFSMDFSLFYFGSYTSKIDPNDKYSLLLESAKHGDQHGYTAVWTPERHFNEFGGLFPNPSILGAALAVATSNVQIRAGSIVSPLHHSVRIAEDWSIIDNLSKGRAALSFACGWQCDDFVFYPERYEQRHQHMLDQIGEVKNLWQGGAMELKNGLGKNISIELFPKPVQGALPIWVTVSGKTETFIDAGKIGANILTHLLWQDSSELKDKIAAYRMSLRRNGFDPDAGVVSVMLHTYVGDNDEEVKAVVRASLKEYIKSSVHLIEAMTRSNNASRKDAVGRYGNVNDKIPAHLLDELVEIAFNRFFEEAALLGSPEKCGKLLRRLRDYGVNELACLIDFGLDQETILKGLDHLTRLKANYDFRITKKYRPTILRTSAEGLRAITHDEGSAKLLRSFKKVIFASSLEDIDLPGTSNILELKYDFSTEGSFIQQVGKADKQSATVKDLSYVNSVIDEDF